MQRQRHAILELDGERYTEHEAYDPLMIEKMWGYPLTSITEIIRTQNAPAHISALLAAGRLRLSNRVLVGGARQGNFLLAFQQTGIKAMGIEPNRQLVDRVSPFVSKETLKQGALSELPFADQSFTTAFFHSSLFMNEFNALNKLELKEISRVLKPDGSLIVEGANGVYWEPIRKKAGDLYEYSSIEAALWALKKDPALAKWRRRADFIWLEFFFITVNSEGLRVNHVYHFVPQQDHVVAARYYHEVVNYEPVEYRLQLLNEAGFTNRGGDHISLADVYEEYDFRTHFSPKTSPGSVIFARRP